MRGRTPREARERALARIAQRALAVLHLHDLDVGVFLVRDAEMKDLKHHFYKKRGTDAPVDVLAFPEPESFPHPERARRCAGEVYLNWDLNRQRPERQVYLLFHGILHLLGYRHERRRDMMMMEKLEKKLWRRVSSLD